jgi:pimeloyl-ACP methyl ester carboxylesterase
MPFVDTPTARVHFTDSGLPPEAGPPLVLLHATLHDHHDFDAIVPAFTQTHRVVTLDWPGHGKSGPLRPPHEPGGATFGRVLADVVTALDLPPAVYVGNSVGGYAAARLALDMPDRVRALVLVNAAGFTPFNAFTRTFCRTLGRRAVTRRLLPRLVPRYMQAHHDFDRAIAERVAATARTPAGVATAAALWRSFAVADYDLRSRAGELAVPVLFAWGMRDVVLGARAGRAAHRILPRARFADFDTGHVVFASDPEGFVTTVQEFLRANAAAIAAPAPSES